MDVSPIRLEGQHVILEPLSREHEELLVGAAGDGELWNSHVTIVPTRETMTKYIDAALKAQSNGTELPFAIRRKPSGEMVGTTRYYSIDRENRNVEIGYTWLAVSAQRTVVNTEAKFLMLEHAFERWKCIRVALITDVLNEQSRAAILRLGAKEEGTLRNHMIMPDGRYRDSVFFSIIESEWSEIKARMRSKIGNA